MNMNFRLEVSEIVNAMFALADKYARDAMLAQTKDISVESETKFTAIADLMMDLDILDAYQFGNH